MRNQTTRLLGKLSGRTWASRGVVMRWLGKDARKTVEAALAAGTVEQRESGANRMGQPGRELRLTASGRKARDEARK